MEGEEYPYKTLRLSNVNDQESGTDLLGYDCFLTASEGYYKDGLLMVQPGDWGHGKNCTLFMFNTVPNGKADNAEYRNPRQSGNVRLQLLFSAATTNNITVMVWSEYKNVFEINNLGGVKYNILDLERERMEFVALSTDVLNTLSKEDRCLKRMFQGMYPADGLPHNPNTKVPFVQSVSRRNKSIPCCCGVTVAATPLKKKVLTWTMEAFRKIQVERPPPS